MAIRRGTGGLRPWWSRRGYALLLVLALLLPMLAPAVLPLADLPGHMGRYRIQLGDSVLLARGYAVHWALIGNLGVDLLMVPLGHLFGVELATRLIVSAIPAATAAGFLLVAREAHGELPPTAAFALPLILGYPFQFGFVNFALSMALAFLAFALWLRLGRQPGRGRLRALLFVPIALLVWLSHAFGWAVLCLLCAAAELARGAGGWRALPARIGRAGRACLPLAAPLLPMVLWHGGGAGTTRGFFDWTAKYGWIQSMLRDHWKVLDGLSAECLVAVLGVGVLGLFRFNRMLLIAALLLAIGYALLPEQVMGSRYADMRLAPFLVAVALLALTPRPGARWSGLVAVAALAFFVVRIGAATASLLLHDQLYARQLEAVAHIPRGARVYQLVAPDCPRGWDGVRLNQIGGLAIVRREAFVNSQWTDAGAQLLTVRPPYPAAFGANPSQLVRLPGCNRPEPLLADRLAQFPRALFDMVWLVNIPGGQRLPVAGLVPVWQNDGGALYRIVAADDQRGSAARMTAP